MSIVGRYFRELVRSTGEGWNRFWFTPRDPATLCLIRILAGLMLLYTHLVWTLGLEDFFGATPWLSGDAVGRIQAGGYAWSYFWLIESRGMLWAAHGAALVVFAMLTVGFCTRVVSVLAWLITVSYANRLPGALFGLDQINTMLAMYLMVGPSGAAWSVDRWLAARRAGRALPAGAPTTSANVATRLIQLHMCVIYLFAGLSKLQGPTWWEGTALWGAIANLEYQSLDVTWLAHWPAVIALMTQVTVAWEIFFCVLVWPRLTRPLVLALALPLHLGIAFAMGMITFGLVMLIGCLSFVSPELLRGVLGQSAKRQGRGGEEKVAVNQRDEPTRQRLPQRQQRTATSVATRS